MILDKFIGCSHKFLESVYGRRSQPEFLGRDAETVSVMRRLNQHLDKTNSFISAAESIENLDPKKNGGALIVAEGEGEYTLYFKLRQLMKGMNIHKALQCYYAVCFITQAEYSKSTMLVSEIVAMYLFKMKDRKGSPGLAKREPASFRLFWAEFSLTDMN